MTKQHTDFIPYSTASNAFHARRFLVDQGDDFRVVITVNWSLLGYSDRDGVMVNRALRQRFLRAWRYRRSSEQGDMPEPRYLEVLENPNGHFHSHTLINLNVKDLGWASDLIANRITKLTGQDLVDGALDIRAVNTSGSFVKYLMKGISPAYADHFYLRSSPQGRIHGRRVSCSTKLGKSARKSAGWQRKRKPPQRHTD